MIFIEFFELISQKLKQNFKQNEMKCKVLMLHGYKGTWNNGWFATIQSKLNDLKIPYVSPSLPNPENPDYQQWKNTILKIISEEFLCLGGNKNMVIVAHSLACFAVLRLIDELLFNSDSIHSNFSIINQIKCMFLVAPIVSFHCKFPQFTNYNLSNLNKFKHIDNVLNSPIKTYLIYSLDDNYVDNEVIQHFISSFTSLKQGDQNKRENSDLLNILYIEKQGYKHFMQDDIPFVTELIIDNCLK